MAGSVKNLMHKQTVKLVKVENLLRNKLFVGVGADHTLVRVCYCNDYLMRCDLLSECPL